MVSLRTSSAILSPNLVIILLLLMLWGVCLLAAQGTCCQVKNPLHTARGSRCTCTPDVLYPRAVEEQLSMEGEWTVRYGLDQRHNPEIAYATLIPRFTPWFLTFWGQKNPPPSPKLTHRFRKAWIQLPFFSWLSKSCNGWYILACKQIVTAPNEAEAQSGPATFPIRWGQGEISYQLLTFLLSHLYLQVEVLL